MGTGKQTVTFEAYTTLDATALAAHVRAGDTDPVELIRMARRAHDRVNPTLGQVHHGTSSPELGWAVYVVSDAL